MGVRRGWHTETKSHDTRFPHLLLSAGLIVAAAMLLVTPSRSAADRGRDVRATVSVQAIGYELVDLGTLPGGVWSNPQAINASGAVVGTSDEADNPGGNIQPFLFDSTGMHRLPIPALVGNGEAIAINDVGTVIGSYQELDESGDVSEHGWFVYSNGGSSRLNIPGDPDASPQGINNDGDIVGSGSGSSGFIYSNGAVEEIGTLGGEGTAAVAINDSDQVVGTSAVAQTCPGDDPDEPPRQCGHAFLYEDGELHDLGVLPGGDRSGARDINQDGIVVGTSWGADGRTGRAFLYDGEQMRDLGKPPGKSGAHAFGVNDLGDVVGSARSQDWADSAVLFTQGEVRELNCFLPFGSPWHLREAIDINNAGQIVAYGLKKNGSNGEAHAFLLTPTADSPPEPNACLSIPKGQTYGALSSSGHSKPVQGFVSDPVNTATGNFSHEATDLALPGIGITFSFTRTYNSLDPTSGPLGQGWTHNHAAALEIEQNGDAIFRTEDGQQLKYTKQQDGSFDAPLGALSTLASITGGYVLIRRDQVSYRFDSEGRLTSVKDHNDRGLTYTYGGSGRLETIDDAAGRTITLGYDGSERLTQVSVPDGRSVRYAYTDGRLTAVTDVTNKVWTYTYDGDGLLEKEVDPRDHTVFRNVYGEDGRVAEQYDALDNLTAFAWDPTIQLATATDARGNVWRDVYSGNVLLERIDALGNETQFGRNGALDVTAVTAADGQRTTLSYDARGNVIQAIAPASLGSAAKTYTYDAKNNVTSVTDARDKVTSYEYDAVGNTTKIVLDGQTVAEYTYNTAGQLTSSTDGRGNTTTYTYENGGDLASETDPLGNKTTYTYGETGQIASRVDPLGNVTGADPSDFKWTFTYDAAGRRLTETNPLGETTTYEYDGVGNQTKMIDANGKTTTYAYDEVSRLVSVTAPHGGITTYTYDGVGNKLTETSANGQTTTHMYDADNRLASTTTPSGGETTYAYDENGNLVKEVEPRGNLPDADPDEYATRFTYDAAGRLLTETDPLGNTTTHAYDALGNETSVTDPTSRTTAYAYDGKNRRVSVTAPDGGVTAFTYDANGNRLTMTDPRGNVTTSAYDKANRLVSIVTPLGNKSTFTYDANGNLTKRVDPLGNAAGADPSDYTYTSTYDAAGRLLTERDPLGNKTTYTYDAAGNRTSVKDAKNHTTSYGHDGAGRLTTVTAPDDSVTRYEYDLAGNLISRTDANNHTTTFEFNADNRPTKVTSPIGQTWTLAYDAAGRLISTVDANGNSTPAAEDGTTTHAYDRAGRLTSIDYSDTTPDVTFAYDAAGRRSAITDGAGPQTYAYDAAGRLAQVIRGTETFAYAYDAAGNLVRRTYPDGTITDYTYNNDSLLGSVTSAGLTTTYGYDAAGRLTRTTRPTENGYVETRTYDRAGRLTEVKDARGGALTLSRYAYTLDPLGNPTTLVTEGLLPLATTTTYAYDALNRLTEVCYQATCGASDPFIRWTYDAVGNRLTEARPSGTTTYSYNAADQLIQTGALTYAYDANGNQTQSGSAIFTYDHADRLTSATDGSGAATYTYDGDGNRLTTTHAGETTRYLWDTSHALPQLALERDASGGILRSYVYGIRRLFMSTSGNTHSYHHDAVGSVTNITSATGATEWTYSYEPFGVIRSETQSGISSPQNLMKFSGELQEANGLYYLRAREYDPGPGRFLGLDPVTPPRTEPYLSSYVYADDRPTVMIDPSGEGAVGATEELSHSTADAISPETPRKKDPGGGSRGKCGQRTWGSSRGYQRYSVWMIGARVFPFPFHLSLDGSAMPDCRRRKTLLRWELRGDTKALAPAFGDWLVDGVIELRSAGHWVRACARRTGSKCVSYAVRIPGDIARGDDWMSAEHYDELRTASMTFDTLRYTFSVQRGVTEGEDFHGIEVGAFVRKGGPDHEDLEVPLR